MYKYNQIFPDCSAAVLSFFPPGSSLSLAIDVYCINILVKHSIWNDYQNVKFLLIAFEIEILIATSFYYSHGENTILVSHFP